MTIQISSGIKKILIPAIVLSFLLAFSGVVLANGDHDHADAIAKGEQLVEDEVNCSELDDSQLEAVGEYFMERMHPGDTHDLTHQRMGMEEGTQYHEDFHVNLAKTLYCGEGSGGAMPMMNMMQGGWSSPSDNNSTNNMMNFGFGPLGGFGGIFMILWWVLVIAGIVVFIKWLVGQSRETSGHEKSALDVLKERYAKGEIDKEEFEEKKKDLS